MTNEAEITEISSTNTQAEVNALSSLNVKQLEQVFNMSPNEVYEEFKDLLPNPFPVDPLLLTSQMVGDILHNYYAE